MIGNPLSPKPLHKGGATPRPYVTPCKSTAYIRGSQAIFMPSTDWHGTCCPSAKNSSRNVLRPPRFRAYAERMENKNVNNDNGFIAWEDISDMEIVGKFPDYTVISAWHNKENRDLTEEELDFVSNNYYNDVQHFVYTR